MAIIFIPIGSGSGSGAPAASEFLAGRTGTGFVTHALRELNVLDPTATAEGEKLEDGLEAATDLLDTWRTERLTIGGVTIGVYPLVSGQQSYTIGPNGNFDQAYPTTIEFWSIVPDRAAAQPLDLPMGRPSTADQWSSIRMKSQTAPWPTTLHFDRSYTSAGLGHILVHPIPTSSAVDIKLYHTVPALLTLVADTTYYLRPGMTRALTLGLALELADRYGKSATVTPRLEKRAADAFAKAKRFNIRPNESAGRAEFAIGQFVGRRTFNIYTGGN